MRPPDLARWTTTLTASYLAITAGLIATVGNAVAYVLLIPSVTAFWYVSGRRLASGELVLMLSSVLLGSYLFLILMPVDSPYYLLPRLGPPLSGHFFFDLVHQMSARGGARGGAYPTAHVSGAVVVCLVAWRHQRRLAYLLVPFTGA